MPRTRSRLQASHRFDGPAVGLDDSHDAPDERGFSRAVGPEQAENGALRHVEPDAIEHLLFANDFGVGYGGRGSWGQLNMSRALEEALLARVRVG